MQYMVVEYCVSSEVFLIPYHSISLVLYYMDSHSLAIYLDLVVNKATMGCKRCIIHYICHDRIKSSFYMLVSVDIQDRLNKLVPFVSIATIDP